MEETVHVVGAAIVRGRRVLVAKRSAGMSNAGKWEIPGGKIEPGESPEQAVAREIREELGVDVFVDGYLGRGTARSGTDPIVHVVLDVYTASIREGEPTASEHASLAWVGAEGLDALDWTAADRDLLPLLADLLA